MPFAIGISKPACEFRVARQLSKYNFPHHVFKIKRRIAIRGRARDRFLPAFPTYIFVGNIEQQWEFLRERCGIVRFLHREIPPGIVPGLVAMVDANGVFPTTETLSRRFKSGQRVRIIGTSALAGQLATFERMIDNDIALVLIPWLGRSVPLSLDERDLMPENHSGVTRRKRRGRRNRRRSNPARH
jgi:hypothetical protein